MAALRSHELGGSYVIAAAVFAMFETTGETSGGFLALAVAFEARRGNLLRQLDFAIYRVYKTCLVDPCCTYWL